MNEELRLKLIEAVKKARQLGFEKAKLIWDGSSFALTLGYYYYESPQWPKLEDELRKIPGFANTDDWGVCAAIFGPDLTVIA